MPRVTVSTCVVCLFFLFSTTAMAEGSNDILGVWVGHAIDAQTRQPVAPYTMRFAQNGTLTTTMGEAYNEYTTVMKFKLEKDLLIVKDDVGKEEGVPYAIRGDKLILVVDGIENVLSRQK